LVIGIDKRKFLNRQRAWVSTRAYASRVDAPTAKKRELQICDCNST